MTRPTTSRQTAAAALALLALALLAPRAARAQDATALAARRELIEQAQQARAAGDHARALDLAERAAHIATNASVRLFIAQEHNALGHLADAYGEASRCAAEASSDTALPNRATVLAVCRALANQLRGRVARVTVRMPAVVPQGASVRVAGRALDEPLWGVPYPVTPGAVLVEASAPGHRAFRREVTLAPGATEQVPVELAPDPQAQVGEVPAGAATSGAGAGASPPVTSEPVHVPEASASTPNASTPPPPATGAPAPAPIDVLTPPTRRRGEGRRDPFQRRRTAGYAVLGVGIGLVVLTVPLIAVREVARADCPNDRCPDMATLTRVRDTVYALSGVSIGLLAVGAIGVTAGIVLLATTPRGDAPALAGERAQALPRRRASALEGVLPVGAWLPEGGAFAGVAGRF